MMPTALHQPIAQRILVTGNAGAGKTSLAQLLATRYHLPYFGLDSVVWKAGWVKTAAQEREERELAITHLPAWVIDGVSSTVLDAADVVILLDYPRATCLWRAIWRNLPYLFRSRPGLPAHCPEILILPALLRLIWRFPMQVRPQLLSACYAKQKCLLRVANADDISRLLARLELPDSNTFANA